ncbi:AraC family transcriptional regulator [Simiduia sp. 21SJ11W-1]|uniref:AraC family transcriptional regulator n=1 Tax=Simiduia sp. 21SJ11W-1 TaxID=2909669 RepID=UPI00209DA8F3|nr:AraC family transcriptional regulator [Simiduia sp. 21SJ11W-1]UTA46872.1 AraC family transcriptional regulator [Simiduia sp. 21SJ11W-1]
MSATVTIHFTRAILNTLQGQAEELPASVQQWLASHSATDRVPLASVDELWQACVAASKDELFGLRAGLNVQPGNLDVVGFLLMSCDCLGEALDALIDYHPIVGEGGEFSLAKAGGECRLIYAPQYETCREQRVAAVMGATIALTRWLTGGAFQPARIAFAHSAPANPAQAQALTGCTIAYNQIADVFTFSESQLHLPLVQANAQVFERMRVLADEALARLSSSNFSRAVADLIREHPALGKDDIANLLHMSGRHLNRKLGLEGGSFKLLQDDVRAKLAQQMLDAGTHVMDIAERLGFSDERSFAKAFKRWRGITPAQFKAR